MGKAGAPRREGKRRGEGGADGDAYELSREYEVKALEAERRGELGLAERMWEEYARLKEEKGSYFLSSYGLYQRSRLLEGEGRLGEAAGGYGRAAGMAERGGDFGLVAFLLLEAARCWERVGKQAEARRVYESLARKWEERGDFFRAADAYERAAGVLRGTGKGWRKYREPGRAWMRCAEWHVRRGDPGDALWALRRAERYFLRTGDREALKLLEERRRGINQDQVAR
ncbi:MAG: hypothetical protein QW098_03920 [Candidatus Hadarchaeales archaeon]